MVGKLAPVLFGGEGQLLPVVLDIVPIQFLFPLNFSYCAFANYPLVCDLLSVTRWAARLCFFLARAAAARLSALRRGAVAGVGLVTGLLSETGCCAFSSGICMGSPMNLTMLPSLNRFV